MKYKFYKWLACLFQQLTSIIETKRNIAKCNINGHCHERTDYGCKADTKWCCYCGVEK